VVTSAACGPAQLSVGHNVGEGVLLLIITHSTTKVKLSALQDVEAYWVVRC
jgi:hypothetical protein